MKVSGPKLIKLVSAPTDDTVDSGKHPGRICYVDDSRTSAYVTKKILTEFGYEVDHYGSAEPAIVALLEKDYDLLLTDLLISAGGMNGDDLVRFLRMSGHPRKKLLPVIVITGTSDKDTLLKIYEAGANGVLVKPITGEELNERIRSLLPEQRAVAAGSGYALEIRDTPQSATKPEAHRAPAETPPVKIPKPAKARRPALPPEAPPPEESDVEALEVQQRVQRIDEIELPSANKRPVTAFGAKKRPTQPEPERSAASVIAELRTRPHEQDEEDIPTLTLALDLSEPQAAAEGLRFEQAIAHLASPQDPEGESWTADRLRAALDAYHADHQHLCLDPNARNIRHTYVIPSEDKRLWRVQQMLVDPEEHNDWVAEFEVDLVKSRETGEPFLRLRRIGSLV